MTLSAGISTRQANTYQHNNGLLFQFILVQFIEVYTDIGRLETLCHRKPAQLDKDACSLSYTEQQRQQVHEILNKLVGSARDYMRLFSWNFGEGLLAKLKTNCALLLNNGEGNGKEFIALQHYSEKVWLGCIAIVDVLREDPAQKEALALAVDKTSSAMQRLAKLMIRLPPLFRSDENVIFCILCHKESLDRLFGPRTVFKLLSKMYPKGLHELHDYISMRYSERGFHTLLSAISTKIAELEVSSL